MAFGLIFEQHRLLSVVEGTWALRAWVLPGRGSWSFLAGCPGVSFSGGHQGSAPPPCGPSRVALSKEQARQQCCCSARWLSGRGSTSLPPPSPAALSCGMALVMWLGAPRCAARVATTTLFGFRMLKWFCLRPLETFSWSEGSVFSKQRPGQAVSVEQLGIVGPLGTTGHRCGGCGSWLRDPLSAVPLLF